MRVSSLQLRCFMTCTADSLSDLARMCFPLRSWPHTTHSRSEWNDLRDVADQLGTLSPFFYTIVWGTTLQ